MRSQHTLLVVDDHPAALYSAVRMLKMAGFEVIEAANGEDALRMAGQASAFLIDVNLPDINGVEVCSTLKSDPAHSAKPVVLMSAVYVDELHKDAGLFSGASAWLEPPLEADALAATFDRLLA